MFEVVKSIVEVLDCLPLPQWLEVVHLMNHKGILLLLTILAAVFILIRLIRQHPMIRFFTYLIPMSLLPCSIAFLACSLFVSITNW